MRCAPPTSASRGAAPVEGQHPLVVLSHDSAGSRFSLHALASQLARNGFVVVAPTHAHDNVDSLKQVLLTMGGRNLYYR